MADTHIIVPQDAPQPQGKEVADWFTENGYQRETIDVLHALAAMKASRDDLLAALKRSVQYIQVAHYDAKQRGDSENILTIAEHDFELVKAAIAKVEGK